jgi:hypothetical protein
MRVRFSPRNKAYTAISSTGGPWAGDMLRRTLVQIATNATNHTSSANHQSPKTVHRSDFALLGAGAPGCSNL